jgi:PiT family inorganic phosphate transporter
MTEVALLGVGLLTAVFVAVNVGGSSTGVCFGPAVGSGVISMRGASALMALFAFGGGVIIGPNVVETMGRDLVPPEQFTLAAATSVLLFTGIGLVLSNYLRISASTSQIAVVAIAGMGVALGVLNWSTFGVILTWWILSAIISFWISVVVGRYFYDKLVAVLDFGEEGDKSTFGKVLVIGVGCYMAFSAGASNVANAVAPLVGGGGSIDMLPAVVLGGVAIGIGAFVIGPRTMATVGNEITDLSLEAALVVELVAGTIITLLSLAGIPASLAIVATLSVIGLGWGRATRRVPVSSDVAVGELPEEEREKIREDRLNMYDLGTSRRIVATWIVAPILAGTLAFLGFGAAVFFGLI